MTGGTTARDERLRGFEIALSNQQSQYPVDEEQLCDAARAVLADSRFATATVSIAVVNDQVSHELNRQYLDHDWPTDVLSFVFDEQPDHLDGEVIISADTAAAAASELRWPAAAEQLLYVIHGMLHLVGYCDKAAAEAQRMRSAEAKYLRQFGFDPSRHAHPGVTAP